MKELSRFTKIVITSGLIFVIYGYLSRLLGIYFFWESKSIGWGLIILGLVGLLSDKVRVKKKQKKKSIVEKIGIGLLVFVLFVQLLLISIIPFTDAFAATKKHLKSNQEIINEIGQVEGVTIKPVGGISLQTNSEGTYGNASISLTVKGEKKFIDLFVYVSKNIDQTEWSVDEISY